MSSPLISLSYLPYKKKTVCYKNVRFKEYLIEAKERKNLRLEHLENEIMKNGINATRDAINFLQSLRDMLAGSSKKCVNVTVK